MKKMLYGLLAVLLTLSFSACGTSKETLDAYRLSASDLVVEAADDLVSVMEVYDSTTGTVIPISHKMDAMDGALLFNEKMEEFSAMEVPEEYREAHEDMIDAYYSGFVGAITLTKAYEVESESMFTDGLNETHKYFLEASEFMAALGYTGE